MQFPKNVPSLTKRLAPALIGAAAVAALAAGGVTLLHDGAAKAGPVSGAAMLDLAVREVPAAPARPDPLVTGPAEKVLQYDFQYQPNFYYCGPASTRIALSASGAAPSQNDLAGALGTTVDGTNSVADVARAMNGVVGKEEYRAVFIPGPKATAQEAMQLRRDMVGALSEGRGVVANIVGGQRDALGVYHEFPGGHYISVVGYRDHGDALLIADPSGMFGSRTYWMASTGLADWAAKRGYSA